MRSGHLLILLSALLAARGGHLFAAEAATAQANDFTAVEAIFTKHCLDCHAALDPEAGLALENFETLMKGGDNGPAIVAGKSADSMLVWMVEGKDNQGAKKKIMPPGKRKKLEPAEIASIKMWIDAGAPAPRETKPKELKLPKILPKGTPRSPVNSLAYAARQKVLAVARYGEVELRSVETHEPIRTLTGHRGNVNAVVFSADGSQLFAAGGDAGLVGEVRQWRIADGLLVRVIEGHKDAIYSLALSPDGKVLATGSYDQKIKLWDVASGKEIRTLSGHNGAVFGLAFRPDGKILASASADRTVKLWDVATGERRETFTQSLKEVNTVAFSPDGTRLAAGGGDNRIRVWQISEKATETTNPLLESRYAHEGAILKLVFAPDGKTLISSAQDKTVKQWDAQHVTERLLVDNQPDWVPALAFVGDGSAFAVGRMDGSIALYEAGSGKAIVEAKQVTKATGVK